MKKKKVNVPVPLQVTFALKHRIKPKCKKILKITTIKKAKQLIIKYYILEIKTKF